MHPTTRRAVVALVLCLAPATRADPPEATPEKVAAAIAAFEELAGRALKATGVPGMAVAVVYRGEAVYLKGFGAREAGRDERVDADTVFQLASVSKPLASGVLAALVGEGVIRWDDRLIDHDPGFRLADPWATREVTIRDMLCHRSGLPDHAGDWLEDLGYDRAEVLRRLRYLKPASSFRSGYAYTNFGYTAAAVAAARAAGRGWEDLAADKLYRPLGMTSTSSRFKDYAASKNRAVLHARIGGQWVAKYTRDADAQSPAGGASSTARDLARWLRLLLAGGTFDGKAVIAADALGETFRPQIVSGPPKNPATDRAGFYGLGWNVGHDDRGRVRLGHSGAFDLGAATAVTVLPAEGLAVAVVTNGSPIGVPEALSASFFDLALRGKVEKDWLELYGRVFAEVVNKPTYGTAVDYAKLPAGQLPPLPLAAYAGTYRNDYAGDVRVVEEAGALQLRLGPKEVPFALRHWDRDVFCYQPAGESAYGPSGVTFRVGRDRTATAVSLENLEVEGRGTFVRVAKP